MLETLVAKYRKRGMLVDSNLLVAYVIGKLDIRFLSECRATKSFVPEDFDLLNNLFRRFDRLVTTPHILTEVSNLSGRLPQRLHREFRGAYALIVRGLLEQFQPAQMVVSNNDFISFGLADTAIRTTASGKYLVLTDDMSLFGLLSKRGIDVINFNHLRTSMWR